MAEKNMDQNRILHKFGIKQLNPMQLAAQKAILSKDEVVLLSPTGTGKTLAFLLPIIAQLNLELQEVQALILTPSRELAIQIEQVSRQMGSGFKVNAVYGGRPIAKDFQELKHAPALLIGTPGRIADHLRRETFSADNIQILILDEFDKSLEVGFEKEMKEIVRSLPNLYKKILTSATEKVDVPSFMQLKAPQRVDFLSESKPEIQLRTVLTKQADKLDALELLLRKLGDGRGIIFCNFKDTIQFISDFLNQKQIEHIHFYGGLDQLERERALIRFRNGTYRILLATDLAARGIDVPALDFIIHYQFPFKQEEFIHRNGRTARMNENGTVYILQHIKKPLPDYIDGVEIEEIKERYELPLPSPWETVFISGGRKDKISKGDIAGLFFKQGGLEKDEVGYIELKQDCAFIAVAKNKAHKVVKKLNNQRLKKRKLRVYVLV